MTAVVTDEGLTTDTGYTEAEGLAHIYPAAGETIDRLPEGIETSSVWEGSTDLELDIGDSTEARRSDSIVVPSLGIELEIIALSPYASGESGEVTWRRFVGVQVHR
jgi:hypothetical protein